MVAHYQGGKHQRRMIRARPGRYSHDVPLPESRLACRRESRETLSSREGGVGELHEAEDSCCLAFDKPRDVRNGSRAAMPSKSPLRRVHPRKRPCWRRAATSALGQEPPLPARSVKLDFRREFREKGQACLAAPERMLFLEPPTQVRSRCRCCDARARDLSFRH